LDHEETVEDLVHLHHFQGESDHKAYKADDDHDPRADDGLNIGGSEADARLHSGSNYRKAYVRERFNVEVISRLTFGG
jgi:hypothetical protein